MKTAICMLSILTLVTGCVSQRRSSEIQSTLLVKSTRSWDGETLPLYPKGQPEITILRIIIPPQCVLPVHAHSVINAGVLLKGQLTVVTETGETLFLKPNDSIVEVVNKWHYGKNEGDEPAEIIVFYAGEPNKPVTRKKPHNEKEITSATGEPDLHFMNDSPSQGERYSGQ